VTLSTDDFAVNTTTRSLQGNPAVAHGLGRVVITWTDLSAMSCDPPGQEACDLCSSSPCRLAPPAACDESGSAIRARFFRTLGDGSLAFEPNPTGGSDDFVVNTTARGFNPRLPGDEEVPSVSVAGNGSLVLAWTDSSATPCWCSTEAGALPPCSSSGGRRRPNGGDDVDRGVRARLLHRLFR
jgi:hypothetical protein